MPETEPSQYAREETDRDGREPTLVVVCGLPGVGKTTVGKRIADRLDGRLFRTDVIRKELRPEPEYTTEETRRVYEELLRRGRETIEDGSTAVLDGTFKRREDRVRAHELSASIDAPCRFVKVECSEDVVAERIAARENDESDADFEIHTKYRDEFEPLTREHVTVRNDDGLDRTRAQIDAQFEPVER